MGRDTLVEILPAPLDDMRVQTRLILLAKHYQEAGNFGIELLNAIGGQAETLLGRLPTPVRDRLGVATEQALTVAMDAAHRSRGLVSDSPGWLSRVMTTAMGAAGGFGGLPTALAELPVTTTVLLRAIQDVAVEHGFDPREPSIQYDCVQVFAAAGPMEKDDGTDLAFLSTRMTVTGAAVQTLISSVAPRLATVLGQKLAAQMVPVLGAAAGAAANYAYTSYYQQMAHVHFGLRRLAIDAGLDHAQVLEQFKALVEKPKIHENSS